MTEISNNTLKINDLSKKKYLLGLIGYPLTHSLSPQLFEAKFAQENIQNIDYKLFEIKTLDELLPLLHTMPQICGLNVTTPYKTAILPYLDSISQTATATNSVNTLLIERKSDKIALHGYNTDVFGFEKSFCENIQQSHNQAIILGNGGVAGSVAFVLKKMSIPYIIVSRKKTDKTLIYSELTDEMIRHHNIIINCTPLGTFPDINHCPSINYNAIEKHHLLFDLIYNPPLSLFLKKGLQKGAKVFNGSQMLEYQAQKSWEMWKNNSSKV
ncbi:MAG: shikimate dehydrogenase [Bacteroidales bacterium]|jgi:shikimate dehydrogenase|nr:shikimate dehydrogenase [Bacteroidales bacterium]